MTQDEIIHMAREAGFDTKVFNSIDGDEVIVRHGNATSICISDELERFFNLAFTAGAAHEREKHLNLANEVAWSVALAEREACAKVVEEYGKYHQTVEDVAAAIRARGETK